MRRALAVFLALSLSGVPMAGAGPRALGPAATVLQDEGEGEAFSPDQLDNLLAPIALYPDPLLAQVLLAATFVDDIDEAARFVRASGPAGVDDQPWDVSVKSVAHYPMVLDNLADHLDWTASVGQAYAAQSTEVMTSIQRLRQMARSQGNLETTPEQDVVMQDDYIEIVPAQPSLIYVPRYSSSIVYYRRPLSGLAITFGVGLAIGAWLNDDCDWRGHRVFYHGWSGGGWIGRSRSYVRITNVYVNPRYSNVAFNRRVVERRVNYESLNRYNAIHRNVTYESVRVRPDPRAERRAGEGRPSSGNAVINRNINTRDPRLDRYRGREDQGRPGPAARAVPNPPPAAAPPPRPGPHAFGKTENGFDPGAASRRGQSSREAAKAPPRAAAPARPAPARPAPPRATEGPARKK